MIRENMKLAIRSLKSNRMRSFLTMLGIIIGISSVIAIMTVGNSLKAESGEELSGFGSRDIDVYSYAESDSVPQLPFTEEVVRGMVSRFGERIETYYVQDYVGMGTVYNRNKKNDQVSVQGISKGYFAGNNVEMVSGSVFTKSAYKMGSNVAIIADKLAESHFGSVEKAMGSQLEVDVNNVYTTYTIVGVYKQKESGGLLSGGARNSTNLFIPLKAAQAENHITTYDEIMVVAAENEDPTVLETELKDYLTKQMNIGEGQEISVSSLQSALEQVNRILSAITVAISLIAGIALLVGGIGVMNIMTVSITERTREIGTRKALGAENRQIMMQFITEAIILCTIGGIIGIILGLGLGVGASALLKFPPTVSVPSIIGSFAFSMVVGLFFGYYPAKKAAKMNPIDALRYE